MKTESEKAGKRESERDSVVECGSPLPLSWEELGDDLVAIIALQLEAVETLAQRWEKEAAAYKNQIEEARHKGSGFDCMLGTMTTLRQCAKDLRTCTDLPGKILNLRSSTRWARAIGSPIGTTASAELNGSTPPN